MSSFIRKLREVFLREKFSFRNGSFSYIRPMAIYPLVSISKPLLMPYLSFLLHATIFYDYLSFQLNHFIFISIAECTNWLYSLCTTTIRKPTVWFCSNYTAHVFNQKGPPVSALNCETRLN